MNHLLFAQIDSAVGPTADNATEAGSTVVSSTAAVRNELAGIFGSPMVWFLFLGAIAVLLMLPGGTKRRRSFGLLFGLGSLGCLLGSVESLNRWSSDVIYWSIGIVTILSAVQTITMRNPIYAAIWFAISLLGTAGLFLFAGAQFLGFATVVVYAGAIVVTFLFVVMLAQPEGQSSYDRISWSGFAQPLAVLAAAALIGITAFSITKTPVQLPTGNLANTSGEREILSSAHMAQLGNELFSRHLISVEIAGTLLLVALVGAVAVTMQQRRRLVETETSNHG